MEYVVKNLENQISITGIVNLHFFEFKSEFATKNEKHPFYELLFVNTGYINVSSEDYTGAINKNEMIIHRHNTVHSLTCPKDCNPTVIIIGFQCNTSKIDAFSNSPIDLPPSFCKQLAGIVKEGRNVFMPPYNVSVYDMKKKKRQLFGSEQMLKNSLESLLIQLMRKYYFTESADDIADTSMQISEVIAYVSDNFLEKIKIDELAFLFNTNRSTLCREFRKNTGKTLMKFINEKKLECAQEKILKTDLTLTAIASEMKFESIHYFTRFFKKMCGMTPKEYRNMNK